MSSIVFDRLVNQINPSEACDREQEIEEDTFNNPNVEVDSRNYLVSLYKNIKNSNQLLNTLVANEQLDYIVLSLLANNEYRFGIKYFSDVLVHEKVEIKSKDNSILSYIDNEELPPVLIDTIEKNQQGNIYYNGCIVTEIRDFRQSSMNPDYFNSYFILLKPTSLSLYNDVKKIINLTNLKYKWNNDARFKLESKLIYLTSPKLCLDPNPCIGSISKRLSRKKLIFCNKQFIRMPRKKLKKTILANEQLKEFKLLNFLKAKNYSGLPAARPKNTEEPTVAKPLNIEYKDIQSLAKCLPAEEDYSQEFVKKEEHIIELLDSPNNCIARLVIYRRPIDDVYFGTLLNNKNVVCKTPPNFRLGDEGMKSRYVKQFVQIYTENGQKMMKITHHIDKEKPVIKLTTAAQILYQRKMALQKHQEQQQLARSASTSQQAARTILTKNNFVKVVHANNLTTQNANFGKSSDQNSTIERMVVINQNGNAVFRNVNMIDQVQNSTIRLSNMATVPSQRFTLPTSTITLNASTTRNTTSLVDESVRQSVDGGLPNEGQNINNDSESNISVTYFPSNFLMSGSTVYTVRPATSNVTNSNQQNQIQQQQHSNDNFSM